MLLKRHVEQICNIKDFRLNLFVTNKIIDTFLIHVHAFKIHIQFYFRISVKKKYLIRKY